MLLPALSVVATSCERDSEPTPEPQITQIYPPEGTPGSLIAVIGLNVKGASSVTFSAGTTEIQAGILSDTANALLVNVPEGLPLGPVTVTVEAPGGSYAYPFEVLDASRAATFTAIAPARGEVGTEVTLTGTNFTGATLLRVGGTRIADFAVNDAGTQITFTVPRAAYFNPFSGTFSVKTPNGTFMSPINVRFDLIKTANVLIALAANKPFILGGSDQTVILTATVTGENEELAEVGKVVFMEGSTVVKEVTEAPFTYELAVASTVAPYTNFPITALLYKKDGSLIMDSEVVTVRVGERIPVSRGTLTGNGEERWNFDGPTEPPFPADGQYAGFLNFDGAGNLEIASGVNLPVSIPETGEYLALLGLASGWDLNESFMWLYFDDQKAAAQRSAEVPPTGWVDFHDYVLEIPYQLEAGEHTAKIRFGGPFVHPYYLDIYKL